MAWLPNDENVSKISLFVFTECTNVTDAQMDGPHRPHLCIASRGKKAVKQFSALLWYCLYDTEQHITQTGVDILS